ncbi:MAG: 50S ribosomal protein L10 [Candidatus Curtissbacteria bacterium]|nr:50S ribosomal protein L10 [Candidatus Curtissbacteria bacterium]
MDKKAKLSAKDIKIETVQSLDDKVSRAKTMAFVNYQGLTVNQISQLRDKIKTAGGEMVVAKNTLMSRALSTNHYALSTKDLIGPTATVFSYEDEIAPIRTIADTAKTLGGIPKFKFGFFGRDLLDLAGIEKLAKIPSRGELQAKVVSVLASPLYGIVNVLQANIRNLAVVLNQIAKKGTN